MIYKSLSSEEKPLKQANKTKMRIKLQHSAAKTANDGTKSRLMIKPFAPSPQPKACQPNQKVQNETATSKVPLRKSFKQIKDTVVALWPKSFIDGRHWGPDCPNHDRGYGGDDTTMSSRRLTFLAEGSVMFRLQTAVCGRPLVGLHSLRKVSRPQASWLGSLTWGEEVVGNANLHSL